MIPRRQVLVALGTAGVAGCLGDGGAGTPTDRPRTTTEATDQSASGFGLSSTAFAAGEPIPARFTCEGDNRSPPLTVSSPPDGTASLALVVDDPDAPGERPFVHWLLWDVPAAVTSLPSGVPQTGTVGSLDGARQGTNGAGSVGYVGPCPPRGDGSHRYRFTLSALDRTLDLPAGANRATLAEALAGARLARTRLTGTFERS